MRCSAIIFKSNDIASLRFVNFPTNPTMNLLELLEWKISNNALPHHDYDQ